MCGLLGLDRAGRALAAAARRSTAHAPERKKPSAVRISCAGRGAGARKHEQGCACISVLVRILLFRLCPDSDSPSFEGA
jgi:hypothetical protein